MKKFFFLVALMVVFGLGMTVFNFLKAAGTFQKPDMVAQCPEYISGYEMCDHKIVTVNTNTSVHRPISLFGWPVGTVSNDLSVTIDDIPTQEEKVKADTTNYWWNDLRLINKCKKTECNNTATLVRPHGLWNRIQYLLGGE